MQYLELELIRAWDLVAAESFAKSDPYVVISGGGRVPSDYTLSSTWKTKTKEPIWNEHFTLPLIGKSTKDAKITLTIKNHDVKNDDFMGYTEVSLTTKELSSIVTEARYFTVPLTSRKGKEKDKKLFLENKKNLGTIHLSLRMHRRSYKLNEDHVMSSFVVTILKNDNLKPGSEPYCELQIPGSKQAIDEPYQTKTLKPVKKKSVLPPEWLDRFRFFPTDQEKYILVTTVFNEGKKPKAFMGYAEFLLTAEALASSIVFPIKKMVKMVPRPGNDADQKILKKHKQGFGGLYVEIRASTETIDMYDSRQEEIERLISESKLNVNIDEERLDTSDGEFYNKQSFIDLYKRTLEWDSALVKGTPEATYLANQIKSKHKQQGGEQVTVTKEVIKEISTPTVVVKSVPQQEVVNQIVEVHKTEQSKPEVVIRNINQSTPVEVEVEVPTPAPLKVEIPAPDPVKVEIEIKKESSPSPEVVDSVKLQRGESLMSNSTSASSVCILNSSISSVISDGDETIEKPSKSPTIPPKFSETPKLHPKEHPQHSESPPLNTINYPSPYYMPHGYPTGFMGGYSYPPLSPFPLMSPASPNLSEAGGVKQINQPSGESEVKKEVPKYKPLRPQAELSRFDEASAAPAVSPSTALLRPEADFSSSTLRSHMNKSPSNTMSLRPEAELSNSRPLLSGFQNPTQDSSIIASRTPSATVLSTATTPLRPHADLSSFNSSSHSSVSTLLRPQAEPSKISLDSSSISPRISNLQPGLRSSLNQETELGRSTETMSSFGGTTKSLQSDARRSGNFSIPDLISLPTDQSIRSPLRPDAEFSRSSAVESPGDQPSPATKRPPPLSGFQNSNLRFVRGEQDLASPATLADSSHSSSVASPVQLQAHILQLGLQVVAANAKTPQRRNSKHKHVVGRHNNITNSSLTVNSIQQTVPKTSDDPGAIKKVFNALDTILTRVAKSKEPSSKNKQVETLRSAFSTGTSQRVRRINKEEDTNNTRFAFGSRKPAEANQMLSQRRASTGDVLRLGTTNLVALTSRQKNQQSKSVQRSFLKPTVRSPTHSNQGSRQSTVDNVPKGIGQRKISKAKLTTTESSIIQRRQSAPNVNRKLSFLVNNKLTRNNNNNNNNNNNEQLKRRMSSTAAQPRLSKDTLHGMLSKVKKEKAQQMTRKS